MESLLTLIAPVAAVGALYVVVPVVADTYHRFRRPRAVICPETNLSADIQLDASEAAASAVVGPPHLQVIRCSRWPERHYCDQACAAHLY